MQTTFGIQIPSTIHVKFKSTYEDDDEIKYCPKAAKILCKSQRDPLEDHLNDKDQAESQVGPIQYPFQWFIRVKVDVLEAQRDTRRKDQHEYKPLKRWCIDDR